MDHAGGEEATPANTGTAPLVATLLANLERQSQAGESVMAPQDPPRDDILRTLV